MPVRVEIGPRDITNQQCVAVLRDNGDKVCVCVCARVCVRVCVCVSVSE